MVQRHINILVITVTLTFPVFAFPDTIHVPGDYSKIQDAIDSSIAGDVVLVASGIYFENITFNGKAIIVASIDGPSATTIDGSKGRVVLFNNNEKSDSVFDGFTITNGYAHEGGGIFCDISCSPTILNSIILNNSAHRGGGLFNEPSASPTIYNCIFCGNFADYAGGGVINLAYASPNVYNSIFIRNTALGEGGGIYNHHSYMTMKNCLFVSNVAEFDNGGGIWNNDSSPSLKNCTFYNNIAGNKGGAITSYGGTSQPTLNNCILWDDIPDEIDGSGLVAYFSCIQGGHSGVGNIDSDPLFVGGPEGYYYLSNKLAGQADDSPCIDTGSTLANAIGLDIYWTRTDEVVDSGIVDMGYHYGYFNMPRIQNDAKSISEISGGIVNFVLTAGQVNANRNYLLVGGVTGSAPGTVLPGGLTTIPINIDVFTYLIVFPMLNTPVFSNFLGQLDSFGKAYAQINAPPVPGAIGITMYYAYCLNAPFDFVSSAVEISIDP